MQKIVETIPLTQKQLEEEITLLCKELLPVSDPKKARPLAEVDAEVRKRAGF